MSISVVRLLIINTFDKHCSSTNVRVPGTSEKASDCGLVLICFAIVSQVSAAVKAVSRRLFARNFPFQGGAFLSSLRIAVASSDTRIPFFHGSRARSIFLFRGRSAGKDGFFRFWRRLGFFGSFQSNCIASLIALFVAAQKLFWSMVQSSCKFWSAKTPGKSWLPGLSCCFRCAMACFFRLLSVFLDALPSPIAFATCSCENGPSCEPLMRDRTSSE